MPPIMMTPLPEDLPGAIRDTKQRLRDQIGDVGAALADVEAAMRGKVAEVVEARAAGKVVFPVIDFDDIAGGTVPEEMVAAVRERGCAVVKGTFDRPEAEQWDRDIAAYLETNRFAETYRGPADQVFAGLASSKPQIYPIYWSKPQIKARQDERMVAVRSFLNGFWKTESEGQVWFDPTRDTGYPDRIRRREPGSSSRGLSPHTDSGSIERWLLPEYQKAFRHIFAGEWQAYDPWDAAYRSTIHEYASDTGCSAFRTFQGWTALSAMQPEDGVLHVVPIPDAMTHVLLRALQEDVAADDLCGAANGQALPISDSYHALLMPALTPIPAIEPGDTVWWHSDVIHAVAEVSAQERWGNVMYIPVSPYCEKNAAYGVDCGRAFLRGGSPSDFIAEDYETDWIDRATIDDLTPIGRKQYGLEPW
ncbi:YbiU family protein [Bauldia litoralis]|uniref:DUF1479 domain-containing protein n=1 Tax=Bauldia litoralis TaxID=665467 RepID=A0A1G6CMV6_9HYPH|nr:YbiU family protein [Bauldia litoralis]SDB34226.1 Protein of unknown function [Bauldia litoralis]